MVLRVKPSKPPESAKVAIPRKSLLEVDRAAQLAGETREEWVRKAIAAALEPSPVARELRKAVDRLSDGAVAAPGLKMSRRELEGLAIPTKRKPKR